jgi:hypothetical protein
MKHIVWMLALNGTLLMANSSKQDDKTGLIWQDNKEITDNSLNYDEAKTYCQDLKVDGFEDWRLPTLREYYTIVDLTQNRPALKNGFEIRDDGRYWTATLFAKNPKNDAWYISMSYGEAEPYKKSRIYHVRCVRNQLK